MVEQEKDWCWLAHRGEKTTDLWDELWDFSNNVKIQINEEWRGGGRMVDGAFKSL